MRSLHWIRRYSYGVGHVMNDLCAAMWFSYLLVFYHGVLGISNFSAGLIMLIGQVADAMFTPFIGVAADSTKSEYGPRKTWHLLGTFCVLISFSFIFRECIDCENASAWAISLYYCCFVVVFQFGWASVQISHLSLIPQLTHDSLEQVSLNGLRYAFTIMSTIAVYISMWLLLEFDKSKDGELNAADSPIFMEMGYSVLAVGAIFVLIFHLGVKEKSPADAMRDEPAFKSKSSWRKWFKRLPFYQNALIYMSSRLMVNISQIYAPLYILHSLHLHKRNIAIFPLVVYVSGFITTLLMRKINERIGTRVTYLLGLVTFLGACVWFHFQKPRYECVDLPVDTTIPPTTHNISILEPCLATQKIEYHSSLAVESVFGAGVLLGMGGSTALVTSLSMTSHLIGKETDSGAFVYGAMSFMDKLSNGIAVQVIQTLHPCGHVVCCLACESYYRQILVYVPGSAACFAFLVLVWMVIRERADNAMASGAELQNDTEPIDIHFQRGNNYGTVTAPSPDKSINSVERRPLLDE
ncbi:major facilitator superfamily domain-containing protein 12-like [Sycon ciliatum]|uniref:major facilitator superfamily domain-containing protein 12-like n=1 Tax=Sycon ciliatum TaxID=27933 RepID=UPI0031F604B7